MVEQRICSTYRDNTLSPRNDTLLLNNLKIEYFLIRSWKLAQRTIRTPQTSQRMSIKWHDPMENRISLPRHRGRRYRESTIRQFSFGGKFLWGRHQSWILHQRRFWRRRRVSKILSYTPVLGLIFEIFDIFIIPLNYILSSKTNIFTIFFVVHLITYRNKVPVRREFLETIETSQL